jgi:hypothetical protein
MTVCFSLLYAVLYLVNKIVSIQFEVGNTKRIQCFWRQTLAFILLYLLTLRSGESGEGGDPVTCMGYLIITNTVISAVFGPKA